MDQYALGIIAYEMLTGKLPFSGEFQVVLNSHLTQLPAPLSQHRPVALALENVVLKMLEKDPVRRFPSLRAVITAFEAALGEVPALTVLS